MTFEPGVGALNKLAYTAGATPRNLASPPQAKSWSR